MISAPPSTLTTLKFDAAGRELHITQVKLAPPSTLTTEQEGPSRHRPFRSLPPRTDRIRRAPSSPSRTIGRGRPASPPWLRPRAGGGPRWGRSRRPRGVPVPHGSWPPTRAASADRARRRRAARSSIAPRSRSAARSRSASDARRVGRGDSESVITISLRRGFGQRPDAMALDRGHTDGIGRPLTWAALSVACHTRR